MSTADPYTYPQSTVLRNKLGIRNPGELERIERLLVAQRASESVPAGQFDLDHLKAIHHHLFQDIYEWAGEIRTIEIAKGGQQFQFRQYIETGIADVHKRLVTSRFLKGLAREDFAGAAAHILGDVNYVHPFREGNGRTQLLYFELLAAQAGHPIDLTKLDPTWWIEASRHSFTGDYGPMAAEIGRACGTLKRE